jgi:hypothetical protein
MVGLTAEMVRTHIHRIANGAQNTRGSQEPRGPAARPGG